MDTDFTTTFWSESVRSFLLHLKAVRAKKIVRFHDVQLRALGQIHDGANMGR
jgi:hypothetical protein